MNRIESIVKALKDKKIEYERSGNKTMRRVCIIGKIKDIQINLEGKYSINAHVWNNNVFITLKEQSNWYEIEIEFIGFKVSINYDLLDRWRVYSASDYIAIEVGKNIIYLWLWRD